MDLREALRQGVVAYSRRNVDRINRSAQFRFFVIHARSQNPSAAATGQAVCNGSTILMEQNPLYPTRWVQRSLP